MKIAMIPALGAVLLLAACGSDPVESGAAQPGTSTMASVSDGGSNGPLTGNAIPGKPIPGSPAEFTQVVGDTIHFATDSYSLDAEAQTALQKQAAWLTQYREHMVTIEGHADERGTREYNLALGDRRAQTVVNYLTALGIDAARVKSVSYGKERPVCADAGDACWQQNRRGVTTLDN